jgi:hypothetical protein
MLSKVLAMHGLNADLDCVHARNYIYVFSRSKIIAIVPLVVKCFVLNSFCDLAQFVVEV